MPAQSESIWRMGAQETIRPNLRDPAPFLILRCPANSTSRNFATGCENRGCILLSCRWGSIFGQGGSCIRCGTCDGFPCREHAKGESDICAVSTGARVSKCRAFYLSEGSQVENETFGGLY